MSVNGTWPHVIRGPSSHTIYLYSDRNSLHNRSELICHVIGYLILLNNITHI